LSSIDDYLQYVWLIQHYNFRYFQTFIQIECLLCWSITQDNFLSIHEISLEDHYISYVIFCGSGIQYEHNKNTTHHDMCCTPLCANKHKKVIVIWRNVWITLPPIY
jgi:hypothetical protein